ncbi:MAG: hypothetical protein RLZZ210_31 [Pseudomonadota bacterium]|jgi:prepilin-type N-terminal cleavage/methylation domain-containing protein
MKKYLVKGFTLLELIVTFGIIGILAIIAIPSIVSVYNTQAETSAATQVLGIFKVARQTSISMRSNVSISLVSGEWIVTNTADSSLVTRQKINSSFLSSLVGIKTSSTAITAATNFGYTSAGVPYANTSFLTGNQAIFVGFSKKTGMNLGDNSTIGMMVDRMGSIYICKNIVDGQITQRCNT